MKMTLIADAQGKLVAAVHGHSLAAKHGEVEARVSFSDGHKLHKVDVEDDMSRITDAAVFHERLLKHMPKC